MKNVLRRVLKVLGRYDFCQLFLFEKVIHGETVDYLMENKIIYRHQSDFGNNPSTNISLSYLADNILTGFDSILLTRMVLINLLKVFGIINQEMFLRKIASLGFSNHSIMRFQFISHVVVFR